ncbi:MAG: lamin tail domain-containing protein, partial [Elusimicrobia bacterium]|nr:lamin tail domain-containing protein [Elusimicrobiota bacterium]
MKKHENYVPGSALRLLIRKLTAASGLSRFLVPIVLLLFSVPVFAASWGDIVITEVMANPVNEDEGEFVEIYNRSGGDIDVTGWVIGDDDAAGDPISCWDANPVTGTITDVDAVTGSTIIPNGYYAVFLDQEYAFSAGEPYNFPPNTIILIGDDTTVGNGLTETDVPMIFLNDDLGNPISSWTFCTDTSQVEPNSVQAIRYDELDSADDFDEPGGSTPGAQNTGYISGEIELTAPCGVSNLTAIAGSKAGTVLLQWTAPGDDGTGGGNAAAYEVKYATKYIGTDDYYASWASTYT